jgi:hypothetical protein
MVRSSGGTALLFLFLALGVSACSDATFAVPPADGGGSGLDAGDAGGSADGSPDGAAPLLAQDTFTRTVVTGLGAAEIGGPWALQGSPSSYAVLGDHATITLATPASGRAANLSVLSSDVDLETTLTLDKLPTGAGMYGNYFGRIVDDNNAYFAQVTVRADGGVDTTLVRDQPTDTLLKTATAPFLLVAGQVLHVRVQVTGVNPTLIRLKVWRATESQPPTWLVSATDSDAPLQARGGVGIGFYLSGSATEFPYVVSFDDFVVRPASGQ